MHLRFQINTANLYVKSGQIHTVDSPWPSRYRFSKSTYHFEKQKIARLYLLIPLFRHGDLYQIKTHVSSLYTPYLYHYTSIDLNICFKYFSNDYIILCNLLIILLRIIIITI